MNADREFVSGYVAIAGKPNVGKSTLLNRLLNFPLSIVTSRPQTTRHKLLGILSKEHYQVVFLDTPGLLVPKYALQKLMLKSAWSAIEEADLVLLMIEPRPGEFDEQPYVLKRLADERKHVILVINKIDLVPKTDLLPVMAEAGERFGFEEILPVSALHADGLDRLTQSIVSRLPHQPPFYPQGELTDRPQRFFVAEIVRQKVFEQFGEEIPYSVAVSVEEYEERKGSKDYIKATIICERESQKGMLIGKGGAAIKRLGRAARDDIEALIGKPVYLELEVEVIRKWRKDEDRIRRLGQI
jgi:GTP-binding protein Era